MSSVRPIPSGEPSAFVFATCFPGSNAWLRRDVSREQPSLRLAYSSKGLVTWKTTAELSSIPESAVAVVSGVGLGRALGVDEVVSLVIRSARTLDPGAPLVLHCYETPRPPPTEHGAASVGELERVPNEDSVVEQRLRAAYAFAAPGPATPGACVVDVIRQWDRPGEFFVGWHVQRPDRPGTAGGVAARPLEPRAPSRAYCKAWELLSLAELSVGPGVTAVELGAAPGGGTWAWLEMGANVVAVDPAEMSPELVSFARSRGANYRHLRKSAAELSKGDLPRRPSFLYSDMNLAPAVVLRYLERVVALTGPPSSGVLANLKVNDEKVEAALPAILQRFAAMGRRLGLSQLRVAQLPGHRREVGVVLRRERSSVAQSTRNNPVA